MVKNCLYLLLAGALLQVPTLARADSPEEQVKKLKKDLQKAQKEIDSLRAELEKLRKEKEDRDQSPLPGELLADPSPGKELKSAKDEFRGSISGVGDDLATISIGSDSGVKVDQLLYVYRMEPKPQYLGKLRITDVVSHTAAGEFTPATRNATIKIGDTVDSKIIGQEHIDKLIKRLSETGTPDLEFEKLSRDLENMRRERNGLGPLPGYPEKLCVRPRPADGKP